MGTVTDTSGAAVAGATVTVTDVARGIARPLTADDAGEYNAPNLVPGTYTVRAEFQGFKTVERRNILVEVGTEVRVDLSLPPGDQAQTVTVTEQLPLVDSTNYTLGGALSNQTINDLPLNGRNYINLVALRPGMEVYPGGGSSTRSAHGLRAEDIRYMIDGLGGDETYTGESVLNAPIPAGHHTTYLPSDDIPQFKTE